LLHGRHFKMNIEIKAIIIVWTSKFGPNKADACQSSIVLSLISFHFPQNLSLSLSDKNWVSWKSWDPHKTWFQKFRSQNLTHETPNISHLHSVFELRLSNYLWPVFVPLVQFDWAFEHVHLLHDLLVWTTSWISFSRPSTMHEDFLLGSFCTLVVFVIQFDTVYSSTFLHSCVAGFQCIIFNAYLVDSLKLLIVKLFLEMAPPLTFLIIKYA